MRLFTTGVAAEETSDVSVVTDDGLGVVDMSFTLPFKCHFVLADGQIPLSTT